VISLEDSDVNSKIRSDLGRGAGELQVQAGNLIFVQADSEDYGFKVKPASFPARQEREMGQTYFFMV